MGDNVFSRVTLMKGVMHFGKRGKYIACYVGPFKVLEKVGSVAYRLALPLAMERIHNVFHVSTLRKYFSDSYHILDYQPLQINEDLSYKEVPTQIMDHKEQVLWSKMIPLVKVLWKKQTIAEVTWEQEDKIRSKCLELFFDYGKTKFGGKFSLKG